MASRPRVRCFDRPCAGLAVLLFSTWPLSMKISAAVVQFPQAPFGTSNPTRQSTPRAVTPRITGHFPSPGRGLWATKQHRPSTGRGFHSLAPPPSSLPVTTAQTTMTLSWFSFHRVSPSSPVSGPSDPLTPSYPAGKHQRHLGACQTHRASGPA